MIFIVPIVLTSDDFGLGKETVATTTDVWFYTSAVPALVTTSPTNPGKSYIKYGLFSHNQNWLNECCKHLQFCSFKDENKIKYLF